MKDKPLVLFMKGDPAQPMVSPKYNIITCIAVTIFLVRLLREPGDEAGQPGYWLAFPPQVERNFAATSYLILYQAGFGTV